MTPSTLAARTSRRARALRGGIIGLLVTASLASGALATSAPASTDCGTVRFSGTRTHIVVLRGTLCTTARRVARAYDRGVAPRPWSCLLAHAPFHRVRGREVGFVCGHGRRGGNVERSPHAF